jgi:hypothetical protein
MNSCGAKWDKPGLRTEDGRTTGAGDGKRLHDARMAKQGKAAKQASRKKGSRWTARKIRAGVGAGAPGHLDLGRHDCTA